MNPSSPCNCDHAFFLAQRMRDTGGILEAGLVALLKLNPENATLIQQLIGVAKSMRRCP